MKRRLLFFVLFALFVGAGEIFAAELNIYASGLRVNSVNAETNEVSIDYFLNAPATALEFQLLNASTGAVVTTVAITGSANLTKGAHANVSLGDALHDVIGGTYKWALKATGTTVNNYSKRTDDSEKYQFYGGRGVAVDNSFESDYFGTIYVTNFGGTSTMNNKRTTQTGVYAFKSDLSQINTSAYIGGLTWGTNSGMKWAIARPCVGPDGTVYITSGSAANSGVWMMNPASPTDNFTAVFGGTIASTGTATNTSSNVIHNCVLHCYIEGFGAERKLYTYDAEYNSDGTTKSGDIFRYDIGTLSSAWTSTPNAKVYDDSKNSNKIQGGDCSIAPDANGGWWISQYRAGNGSTSVPCLIHITSGTIDYNSGTAITSSYQGGMAVSVDGKTLAIGTTRANSQNNIAVYDVTYDSNNAPTLTLRTTIPWSGGNRNAKGLAFDIANNLYAIDNNAEMFAAFATHGATEFTTPAASSRTITLSTIIDVTHVTGVELDETSKTVKVGDSFTLTPTVLPVDATDKSYSWSTTDASVATISNGTVTAVGVGSADITVTTTDGSKTATCAVTVEAADPLSGTYKIGGSNANYATLYDAVSDMNTWGIGGDITLLVCGNLTETQNIGLVNTTNYTITIRPDADADRAITFSQTSDNGGPSGAFIIGANFGIADMTATATKNIIIDGLASAEATHKMTIQCSTTFGSGAGVIVLYGGVTNTIIRNCTIVNNLSSGATRAHCINVRCTASAYPNGILIEGNDIRSTTLNNAATILINGSASSANPPMNTVIRNNEITSLRDGILFQNCKNITIENNIFRIKGSNGVTGKGIGTFSGSTSQTSGDIIIRKNQFIELITNNGYVANGFVGIEVISNGNWTIENNLITGFDAKSNTRKGYFVGIKTGGSPSSINIQHNTMYMPAFNKTHSLDTLLSTEPVTLIYIAGGSPVIKNNILVSMEKNCVNSLIRGSLNSNCLNNVYYIAGSKGVIVDGAKPCANWAAFNTQYATQAASSAYQQISLVDNYKLASQYIGLQSLGVDPIGSITTDVEGNTRNTTKTYAGCYEHSELAPIYSPTTHILPYDLRRTLNNDGLGYTFTFKSNIAATSGKIIFYQSGVKKGEVTISSAISAGANEVVVLKSAMPDIEGVMTWAVELTGAPSKVLGELTNESRGIYNYYTPQCVVVDNSTESDYFGNIYVTEPANGESDGLSPRSQGQKAGLFVYDPQLNELNPTSNNGYTLGLTLPATNRHGFKRINVDAQGNVYVNSNSAIYKASPADLSTSIALAESKFTAINAFCIDGDIFYVMDNGTALKKLQSGSVTTIFTESSHMVSSNTTDLTVLQDGRGGWWIAQSRANADTYYSLLHVNSSGTMDFGINQNTNQDILSDCNPKSTRGGLALNRDKTILAMGSNSSVIFFDIEYDGAGKPTITRKPWVLPTLGYNIDGVAFDYADNLYVVSASTERFYAFALPTETNTTCVPAKSTLTVDSQPHVAVTSITLSQSEASIEVGSTLDLTVTVLPDAATDKTVEWISDNTSVAEVNPSTGRVTAIAVGTAHIKAVSTADEVESAECAVTVYTLDFNITWNTNGASYTTTLLSSNSDLWSQFMTGYNAYYTAKGKSSRAIQPMTAVATFAYHGVIDLFTDPESPWLWLGTYINSVASAQGITLSSESQWTTALQDFFSCTTASVNFTTAGQPENWLTLWKEANNYLPTTMRATDEMPVIRKDNDIFAGWYDNSSFTGNPVEHVTEDVTLYAKWIAPVELDEEADNASAISTNVGKTVNVILKRPFTSTEHWYTLVLPFDVTAAQLAETFGAGTEVAVLQESYWKDEAHTSLYLNFMPQSGINAGEPCLFKPARTIDEEAIFRGVTIVNDDEPSLTTNVVDMIGMYAPTEVTVNDVNYYLGNTNFLHLYVDEYKYTKGFRAYFHFNSPLPSNASARVVFNKDVVTGIEDLQEPMDAPAVQKVLRDGQLIIIHDGKEFNVQGQLVR